MLAGVVAYLPSASACTRLRKLQDFSSCILPSTSSPYLFSRPYSSSVDMWHPHKDPVNYNKAIAPSENIPHQYISSTPLLYTNLTLLTYDDAKRLRSAAQRYTTEAADKAHTTDTYCLYRQVRTRLERTGSQSATPDICLSRLPSIVCTSPQVPAHALK